MAQEQGETIGPLPVVRTVAALRRQVSLWRAQRETVALVPTMGALHAGHLALVARGKALCSHAVATLFVNPTQFGPNEDLSRYPRDERGDAVRLADSQCDLLFAPDLAEMYPPSFATEVHPGPVAAGLDGVFRPGHFTGVATVVTKLLLQGLPDVACFGEKDYQQLQIIRRITRDLDIPVRIEPVATVREADGLALSSRNAYLSPAERKVAPVLQQTLLAVAARVRGDTAPAEAAAVGKAALLEAGFASVDYLAVVDAETLVPLETLDRPGRVLVAARLGTTRLIDNIPLLPS